MSRTESANTVDIPATGSVGVIGLGVMGHAIATRLLDRLGHLDVTDLHRAAADDLVAGGAEFQDTAAAVAAHTEVVVLSLNTAPIVEQVVFGAGGVLQAGRLGAGRAHHRHVLDRPRPHPRVRRPGGRTGRRLARRAPVRRRTRGARRQARA